jgi:preprotein translocase subunit SecE
VSDEHESERPGRERPSNAADRRGRRASRSGSGGTPAKGRATPTRAAAATQERKVSLFGRLTRFLREVVAELRKVIWPNRSQMVKYTIAVLIFVSFMVAFVFLLDSAFAEGVALLFGD